jgi:hypothetical protein
VRPLDYAHLHVEVRAASHPDRQNAGYYVTGSQAHVGAHYREPASFIANHPAYSRVVFFDEESFTASGTWTSRTGIGDNSDMKSAATTATGTTTSARLSFPAPSDGGNYRVAIHVPWNYGTSQLALYRLSNTTNGQTLFSKRVNQAVLTNSWTTLASTNLIPGNTYSLEVLANTGESGKMVALDSVMLVRDPQRIWDVRPSAATFVIPGAITVTWRRALAEGTVKISLKRDSYTGSSEGPNFKRLTSATNNDGSETFSLPATLTPASDWRVWIAFQDADPADVVSAASPITLMAADTTPPSVSITAPASGATVTGPATVSASASDSVGLSRVEFFLDGVLVATDTTAPYSWLFSPTASQNGSRTLNARAYDTSGNSRTSSGVTVNVAVPRSYAVSPTTPVCGQSPITIRLTGYLQNPTTVRFVLTKGNSSCGAGGPFIQGGVFELRMGNPSGAIVGTAAYVANVSEVGISLAPGFTSGYRDYYGTIRGTSYFAGPVRVTRQ